MTTLMEILYEYTNSHRLEGFIDRRTYEELEELETRNLEKLKEDLSARQLDLLEKYQDACQEQRVMKLEAMFLAAFSVARELL